MPVCNTIATAWRRRGGGGRANLPVRRAITGVYRSRPRLFLWRAVTGSRRACDLLVRHTIASHYKLRDQRADVSVRMPITNPRRTWTCLLLRHTITEIGRASWRERVLRLV